MYLMPRFKENNPHHTCNARTALRCLLASALTLSAPAWCASFELQPSAAGQPFYRSALPAAVYGANATSTSDWVVKNGAGEAVPFALVNPPPKPDTRVLLTHSLPVFAITQEALSSQGTQINVEFSKDNRSNASIKLQSQAQTHSQGQSAQNPLVFLARNSGSKTTGTQGPSQDTAVMQLQVKWRGAAGQFIGVEVLASDDLQSFRPIAQATLLNLKKADETILQDTVAFASPVQAKYFQVRRVSNTGDVMSNGDFAITALISSNTVTVAGGSAQDTLLSQTLSAPAVSSTASQTYYDFQTNGRYGAQQLQLGLPQLNTITPVSVYTRNTAQQPWSLLSRSTVYRLAQKNSETISPALSFAAHNAVYWRVEVDKAGGGLGSGVPTATLRWQPSVLIWNARGQGPFKLTVGEAQTSANSLTDATQLLPGYTPSSANALVAQLPEATLGTMTQAAAAAPKVLAAKPVSEPSLRWWLWGGLALGVLLLTGMGYSLLKQSNRTEA
jgi:hypothetical protein